MPVSDSAAALQSFEQDNGCLKLCELFEHAPAFVALAAVPDFRILYANRAWRDLVQRQNVVGRLVRDIMPEIEGQGFLELADEACSTGRPISRHFSPIRIQSKDTSELKFIDFVYQPIKDEPGRVFAVLAVGSDVTTEHHATLEATRLTEELYETRRSILVEGLSASLSHELKQPLSAASNYLGAADIMLNNFGPESAGKIREMIASAQDQVHRAGEIINGLRALSGVRLARRESTHLGTLLSDIANSVRASGSCAGATITVHCEQPQMRITCDPAQIFKVVGNLLRNACRAAETEVRVFARSSERQMVEIVVEDDGPGFSEEMLESGPHLGQSTTGGLGIGLVLSEALLQAHGGHLTIGNYDGGGRVKVMLPGDPD